MVDVTDHVAGLNTRKVVFGITFEQLILLLYPTFLIPVLYLWLQDLKRRRQRTVAPLGCVKLGVRGKSNADDEFDTRYSGGTDDQAEWRVKAIYIWPVKSCGPVELDSTDVDAEGLTYDRKFAFAELLPPNPVAAGASEEERKPKWTFRTLRQPGYEKLALVKTEVWIPREGAAEDHRLSRAQREGSLIVRYPYEPAGFLAKLDEFAISCGLISHERSFRVPLNPLKDHHYPHETVNIWRDNPTWLNMGEHLPDDFQRWLDVKHPLSLFRADPEAYRKVMRCAPRADQVGYQPVAAFQDAYPLNLLNLASVRDVADKVADSIPRFSNRRFRTNFLLTGPPAYDEDDWKRIKLGHHEIYCACRTVRCRLPNVDPDTAIRHPSEPDKTLKATRCIDAGDPLNACLGLQLVPASNARVRIAVGDQVHVLERGAHHYIKQ